MASLKSIPPYLFRSIHARFWRLLCVTLTLKLQGMASVLVTLVQPDKMSMFRMIDITGRAGTCCRVAIEGQLDGLRGGGGTVDRDCLGMLPGEDGSPRILGVPLGPGGGPGKVKWVS